MIVVAALFALIYALAHLFFIMLLVSAVCVLAAVMLFVTHARMRVWLLFAFALGAVAGSAALMSGIAGMML